MKVDFEPDGHDSFFWNKMPFPWTTDELVDLARRHPRFATYMAPRWHTLAWCPNIGAATNILDYIERVQSFDECFQSNPHCHPTTLLDGMAENQIFTDQELASLSERLVGLGAIVNQEVINLFDRHHPDFQLAHHTLLNYQSPDLKEPAEV
jgi:hypothetical protein